MQAVDETSLLFEQFLIDLCANETDSHGFQISLDTPRSFNDVSSKALFSDQWRLVAGYSLMFLFCTMVLGRITHLQVLNRFYKGKSMTSQVMKQEMVRSF